MFSAKDRNPFIFFENCANLRSPVEYIPYILIKHNYLTKDAASLAKRTELEVRRIEKRIEHLQLTLNVKLDLILKSVPPARREDENVNLDQTIQNKIDTIMKEKESLPMEDIKAIDDLQKELQSLLKLQKDEQRIKYIFCGKPLKDDAVEVMKKLDDIRKTRTIPKNDGLLQKNFGKNFKTYWGEIGADYYSEINFIYYYILPDSNVHYVQSLIEILLEIPIDYQYVWGHSSLLLNARDSLRFYYEDFYRFNYDVAEENVSKTNVKTFLTKLGFSSEEVSMSFEENDFFKRNSGFSVEDLMREAPLCDIITGYFEYQSLNFQNIYQKKMKIGHFPDTNPFFAVVNESTRKQYANLYANERNRIISANFYHKTLANFNLKNNEIHFVSLLDFSPFLKTVDDDADLRSMVDSVFKRYFQNISDVAEYLKPNSELRRSLDIVSKEVADSYNSVFHFMHIPIEIAKPVGSSMNILNILESIFKVDFAFKNYFKMPLNVRDIVNQFRLNDRVPFVRLFDEQRNENIYRIFKESFTMDNLDKIKEDTFKSWLFMENVTVELKQLTKITEMKRCLTFKLRLCNQIKTYDDPLKIEEYNAVYEDNLDHSKFTVRYSKNGQIEGNIEEYLFTPDKSGIYHHKPVYMNVYIFTDGTMRIKCVFDPNCIFNVNYLNAIQDSFNYFIKMISDFSEVSNSLEYVELCDILTRPNDNYLTSTLTNGCLLEYTYTDNFYIGYENLKHIVKMFSPYFVIVEADLDIESSIVFYDRGSYRDAAIVKVLPNNRYNIRVRGEARDIEDVPRYLLNLKGETKSIGFLNFRYKRVSNYKSEQEDDWHLDKNGIDIKFYFETQENTERKYKFEISNFKNVADFNTVIELLGRILDLHYLYFVSKDLSLFEHFNLIQSDQIIMAIATKDVDVVPVQSDDVYSSLGLNAQDDFQDFPDASEFDEMMPSMEGLEFSPNAEPETPSAAAAIQESSTSGIETQQTTISSKNLLLSTLYESDLNQFKNYDGEKWKYTTGCQPNNKRYPKPLKKTEFSKIVNMVRVEPVADSIDLPTGELPYSAGLGLTYLGNKPGIAKDPEEKYCVPGDAIDPKKKCVSIVYGSIEDQSSWQNVFMCPKIWCMLDRIPLHPRHLEDGSCGLCKCNRFVSVADVSTKDYNADRKLSEQNDIDNWRTCKTCSHDILHHNIKCPVCHSGPLDENNHNYRPTTVPIKTSLFISPLNGTYIYPGFLDSADHPKNIHSMCCFKNPNFRLNQAYKMKVDVSEQSPKYIQSDGKSLDRGRCGQLPHNFKGFFDLPANYYNITSLADKTEKENMLYRFGVNMGNNNVLDCMRAFILKDDVFKKTPEIFEDALAKNMQLDILLRTPLMYHAMTDNTAANLSPVQIFIEYLYSDAYKYDMTFFQFLNRDWSWMGLQAATDMPEEIIANGVNIFVFAMNVEGKLVLELPLGYLQPYQRGVNAYSILLFKKTDGSLKKQMMDCDPNERSHVVYEPIFGLKPQAESKKKPADEPLKWDKFQKAFHWDHAIIKNIMTIIQSMGNQLVQAPKLIYDGKDDIPKRTVEWLLHEKKERVRCLITDASNLIIAAILKDKMYIPLFPTSYDGVLPTMNQTSYWEDYDLLQNYDDCLDRLYAYQSRASFEWIRPVKIIRGKGGYIGFMTLDGAIIPFQEIKLVPNNMLPVMDLDYQEIENAINRFRQKMVVSKRMTFADLLDLNVPKEKMFILRDEIIKNKIIKTILFPTGKKDSTLLEIPIEPETYNPDYHPNPYTRQKFKTYKYQDAIKMYHDLYYHMMGKIRCSPVGVRMNADKKIQSIFLETGDEIEVSATVHVYDRDSKNNLLLHYFSNLEKSKSVSKLTGYDWNRYFMNANEGDVRVHYIQSINYKIKSYIRFRFEIAQILSIYAIDKKKKIEKILQLPNSNQEKRKAIFQIISDIIVKFMSVEQIHGSVAALIENSGDVLENCLSHNNNSTACSKDPFCSWHPIDESKKQDWIVSEKEKSSVDQEKMKQYIISNGYSIEDEPDESDVEVLYWDLRFEKLGNCKLQLDSNAYTKFIHQIVEELVRNNLKRSEILGNTIKLVETNLSYNIYSGERFLTNSDVRQRLYEDIYCKLLRFRLKTLEYFTRNSSMYSKHLPELFIADSEELLNEFQLVHRQILNVRFERDGAHECVFPENNRQSLVRILDEVETQRALHRILVLNTPLDTYRVASTSTNVDFVIESIPADAETGKTTVYRDADENTNCSVHKTMQECEKFDCLWGKTGKCSKKRGAKSQEKPPPSPIKPTSPTRKPKPISPKKKLPQSPPKPTFTQKPKSPKKKPSGYAEEVPLVENSRGFRLRDVVRVPADGTCLFHSAAIGLRTVGAFEGTGHELRALTAQYLKDRLDNGKNLNIPINQSTLNKNKAQNTLTFREYLLELHYQGEDPEKFMKKHIKEIAQNKWGTDIEVWAFQNMFPRVNIDVYSAPRGDDYLRKSIVGQDDATLPTIRIYNAAGNDPEGTHYDALPASRPKGAKAHEAEPAAVECPDFELGQPVRIKGQADAKYFIDRRWSQERAGQCVGIRVVSRFINGDEIDHRELRRVNTEKLKDAVGFNNGDIVEYDGNMYEIFYTHTTKENEDDLTEKPTQHFIMFEVGGLEEVPLRDLELN